MYKLTYWFKSTFGSFDNSTEYLNFFNNLTFKERETIKSFNLHFIKLYNCILEVIQTSGQEVLVHYYSTLPPPYQHQLDENNANFLGSSLQTYLEFEE